MGEETTPEHEQQKQSNSNSNSNSNKNIPNYDITQLKVFSPIGRGAKGVVFRIRIDNSDEDLALKVVLKSSIKKRKNNGDDDNGDGDNAIEKSRVFFEQKVLREFNHCLLPRLRGVFETENIFGYAIDYCCGGNLSLLRKQQVEKMFSDDIIRFYGAEMVLALEYLHKKGIVYRDLKPDNILIQDNGHLMLVDFDLSTKLVPNSDPLKRRPSLNSGLKPELELPKPRRKKSQIPKFYAFCKSGISPEDLVDSGVKPINSVDVSDSDSVGKSNSFVGTEEYVAPEIIQGHGHDFAVDLWSLGVVLYEMLYGMTPFRGINRKETFYRILSKTPELVGETTPLRDLIGKLLQKDPKLRITFDEIKGHDFFKGVDWEMILRLSRPPHIPQRQDVVEGVDGIKAIDVESIVHGIFKKEDVPINNNNNNKNDNDDNDNDISSSNSNGSNSSKSRENNTNSSKTSFSNGDESIGISMDKGNIKKGVWVGGLEEPPISNDFLVF